jgi:hypothetical protein
MSTRARSSQSAGPEADGSGLGFESAAGPRLTRIAIKGYKRLVDIDLSL